MMPLCEVLVDYLLSNLEETQFEWDTFQSKFTYEVNTDVTIIINCYAIPQTGIHTMRSICIIIGDEKSFVYEDSFREMGYPNEFIRLAEEVNSYVLDWREMQKRKAQGIRMKKENNCDVPRLCCAS